MFGLKVFTEDKFIEDVYAVIRRERLIEKGDTVVSGLSGGADSVALLCVLYALSEKIGFKLKAAHLNHMIRGAEAERDERFAKELCEGLGLEFHVRRRDIPRLSAGKNAEEVGREERYRFFNELSENEEHGKIAVAHNLDDLAETVLMRLARGSSVSGLSGIKIRNKNIIRPLLYTEREKIEGFLHRNGIGYVTDSTNLSDEYTRNKVRHTVLPALKEINPAVLFAMRRTAKKLSDAADFIEKSAKEAYGEVTDSISIEKIKPLHRAQTEYIVAESAYCAGVPEISDKNLSDIISLFDLSSGKRASLPNEYEAVRIYDEVKFSKRKKVSEYYYPLKMGHNYIKEADCTVTVELSRRGLDLDKLSGPLYARPKREGDCFRPVGCGGTKKIKRLFADAKLPVDKRESLPIIASGGKIVFALGRADEAVVSDENTKNAVTIKITEGELK